jgi:hypothetical protein
VVVGLVFAEEKFFSYMSAVETDEYSAGSMGGELRRPSGVLDAMGLAASTCELCRGVPRLPNVC